MGHLHVGCSKEVTVTFCSSQPVTLTSQPVRCKVCQVQFQQPLEQVADWDDRQRTVQWLSSSKQTSGAPQQHVKNKVNILTVIWKRCWRERYQFTIIVEQTCICLHAGDKDRSWALLLCGWGLSVGAGIAYQRSLWLCEVQLQHRHHPLQRHHALPNQGPPVSQALGLSSICNFIKPKWTIQPANDIPQKDFSFPTLQIHFSGILRGQILKMIIYWSSKWTTLKSCLYVYICRLQIVNHGAVKLEFSLQVLMDPSNNIVNHDRGGIYMYNINVILLYMRSTCQHFIWSWITVLTVLAVQYHYIPRLNLIYLFAF